MRAHHLRSPPAHLSMCVRHRLLACNVSVRRHSEPRKCAMSHPQHRVAMMRLHCRYGLDYAEKYRSLPYIGVMREDAIS